MRQGFYVDMRYPNDQIHALARMAEASERYAVELIVAVCPTHAVQLEAIRLMGQWDAFERRKRDHVIFTQAAPGAPVLWDFANYDACTTEPLPAEGDRSARMTWWIDNSHFRPLLGGLAVDRVSGLPDGALAEGFGLHLTPSKIDEAIERLRRRVERTTPPPILGRRRGWRHSTRGQPERPPIDTTALTPAPLPPGLLAHLGGHIRPSCIG